LATVLVKARVSGLDAIPWFFNFTEGSDLESNCWTAQCEILLTRLPGAQAQDEDFPPVLIPIISISLALDNQVRVHHLQMGHQTTSMQMLIIFRL
jgi:hypothetical protein